jgi:hypothetical protein
MIRTISIGSSVFIQGTFVRDLSDGQIAVRVFGGTYVGRPIESYKARETANS